MVMSDSEMTTEHKKRLLEMFIKVLQNNHERNAIIEYHGSTEWSEVHKDYIDVYTVVCKHFKEEDVKVL